MSDQSLPPPAFPAGGAGKFIAIVDRVVGVVCSVAMAISALAMLASLVLISYSVVMRYVFNSPAVWVDDTVGFLLVAIVMMAAADALRRGEHIGVDVLTARLQGKAQRIVAVWGMLAVLLAAGFLVYDGWKTAMFSKMLGIVTSGHMEIPIYLLQLMMPAGGALLFLAAVVALLRTLVGVATFTAPGHLPPREAGE